MAKELTDQELEAAARRGLESEVREARATAARFDRESGDLVLTLRGGMTLLVPLHLLQGMAEAAPELVEQVELAAGGSALHWEELDADFGVQDIVAGSFGVRRWMNRLRDEEMLDEASVRRLNDLDELAARTGAVLGRSVPTASEMGRKGGSTRSPAKAAAARANGKKGGRPKTFAT